MHLAAKAASFTQITGFFLIYNLSLFIRQCKPWNCPAASWVCASWDTREEFGGVRGHLCLWYKPRNLSEALQSSDSFSGWEYRWNVIWSVVVQSWTWWGRKQFGNRQPAVGRLALAFLGLMLKRVHKFLFFFSAPVQKTMKICQVTNLSSCLAERKKEQLQAHSSPINFNPSCLLPVCSLVVRLPSSWLLLPPSNIISAPGIWSLYC